MSPLRAAGQGWKTLPAKYGYSHDHLGAKGREMLIGAID